MGMLTKEQLDHAWNDQGMKYNVGRFHHYLKERGLLPLVTKDRFVRKFYWVLEQFLVKGTEEYPNGRQRIADTGRDDSNATG